MNDLLSLYWTDADGNQHRELHLQPLTLCGQAIERLAHGPAAKLGVIKSILLVDSLDCTVASYHRVNNEWRPTPL